MQRLLPFRRAEESGDASAAIEAADRSHRTASADRERMAKVRQEAERLAAEVRAHNSANRYDEFLQRAMRGDG